ncbi:MAG: zinc ribbon domain-containing protein [Eubacteriaceae bacterium]|nr:zinc ribbon domain-containing protein [Eubacteriaceae bacterium]
MRDVFTEGLGNLVKNLSGILPQDDPDIRILTGKADLAELQRQCDALYIAIGKEAMATNGAAYGDKAQALKDLLSQIADIQEAIETAQNERDKRCEDIKSALTPNICPQCGKLNEDGAKFCCACGAPLDGSEPSVPTCPNCGKEYPEGTKFCSECGTKLQ